MSKILIQCLKKSYKKQSISFNQYRFIRHTIKDIIHKELHVANNGKLVATGWVKTLQYHKNVTFIKISDGSSLSMLQVVIPPEKDTSEITFGSSVSVEGTLVESIGQRQKYELVADKVTVLGKCHPEDYPYQVRNRVPVEYSREIPHLRPRTNFFSSLLRLRNGASNAVHKYFQENGFLFVHTPILTSNDCEGGGEVFTVEPGDKNLIPATSEDKNANTQRTFFRCPANLTVSGQLHLEVITGAISQCYNFGPTFRADNSYDRTHLAEFYMIEAEIGFIKSLEDILQVIEGLTKYTIKEVQNTCDEDLQFYYKYVADKGHQSIVQKALNNSFTRMSYTDAVKLLEKNNKHFEYKISWGEDLKREHEKYLVQYNNNLPVFITDFPACFKPFYARVNEDGQTVSSVDLLVPDVGELVGGSMREERYEILKNKLEQNKLTESLNWYLELRRFGTVPHGGFGMGFERLLLYMLGIKNIRETIPFPRWSENCKL